VTATDADGLCPTSAASPATSSRPAPLRFGITPQLAGSAGSTQQDVAPEDPAALRRALADLRPPRARGRLVVRLNRLFSGDGDRGIARFDRLARSYARRGFLVESQVRYHPRPEKAGDVGAFARFAQRAVTRLARSRAVIGFDITNEINIPISANTSDGAYPRALDALVAGTVTARRALDRIGRRDVSLGFTYAWRWIPESDRDFWRGIGERATPAFRRAVGHVGIQLYPGLFFPPAFAPGQSAGDATVAAVQTVRRCMLPQARLPRDLPVQVSEIGYATNLGRSEAAQAQHLRSTVARLRATAGSLGVTDVRWFNLRDNDSDGTDLFDAVGLLRDDHTRKAAFAVLRDEIRR
jgi:hypothetical protein